MKFKQGVPDDIMNRPDPRILNAREIYDELLAFYFSQGPGTITSTNDGKHDPNSQHYKVPRTAEDWRFPDMFRHLLYDLNTKLGQLGLKVIIEKDHFHIQG